MAILTVTYTLPNYLACPLINSDCSGLTDDENAYLDDWIAEKVADHGGLFHCVGVEDYGYCHQHDYDNMGADCGVFTFHVNEEFIVSNKPNWIMQVPVISTAHVPENYRELLPAVCAVVATYDCGDFFLLTEDWKEKAHADLLPVLEWFTSEFSADHWLRLDADGCTLEGVKNFFE